MNAANRSFEWLSSKWGKKGARVKQHNEGEGEYCREDCRRAERRRLSRRRKTEGKKSLCVGQGDGGRVE